MSKDKIYSAPSAFGIDSRLLRFESPTPITQKPSPLLYSTPEAQEQSSAERNPATSAGECLLAAFWRSPDRHHQIGILDRQTGRFSNIPVKDPADAIELAQNLSGDRAEVYFACAEYQSSISRTVPNVYGAFGFWLDIDCCEDKAAAGKGYPTPEAAEVALLQFCNDTGLPRTTHIVHSGGGIHAYWALNGVVVRDEWQSHARKLKDLTKAHRFLADDSRTADIASVLRIPGTLNHKITPPRPVTLEYASDDYIKRTIMLNAIDVAHARLCGAMVIKQPSRPAIATTVASTGGSADAYGPPDLDKLSSALAMLEPDCDEETWKLRRLAPLAEAARNYPDMEISLYELSRSWSSGDLRGEVSMKWITPGGNGRTGAEVFDEIWLRFLTSNYPGVPTTLGTLYYDAMMAGWDQDDQFQIITTAAGEDA